jgi:hypothetical protein
VAEGRGKRSPYRFRYDLFSKESPGLSRFTFQKCPHSDLHRDCIGFEPIFSALEYVGEGAPGRICTDTLPGLGRSSLRWNTGAKEPPFRLALNLLCLPNRRIAINALAAKVGYRTWTRTKISQIQSLWSYFGRSGNKLVDSAGIAPATCALGVRCSSLLSYESESTPGRNCTHMTTFEASHPESVR